MRIAPVEIRHGKDHENQVNLRQGGWVNTCNGLKDYPCSPDGQGGSLCTRRNSHIIGEQVSEKENEKKESHCPCDKHPVKKKSRDVRQIYNNSLK